MAVFRLHAHQQLSRSGSTNIKHTASRVDKEATKDGLFIQGGSRDGAKYFE